MGNSCSAKQRKLAKKHGVQITQNMAFKLYNVAEFWKEKKEKTLPSERSRSQVGGRLFSGAF